MRLLCLGADTVNALISLHAPFDDLTPAGLWGTTYHLVGMRDEQRDVLRRLGLELEDVTPDALQAAGAGARADARPESPTGARTPGRETSRSAAPAWVEATPGESEAETPAAAPAAATATAASSGPDLAETDGETATATSASSESTELESAGAEAVRGDGNGARMAASAEPAEASRSETEVGLATTAGADSLESGEEADEEWSYLDGDRLREGLRLRTRLGGKRVEGRVREGKVLLDGKTFDSPRDASRTLTPNATEREIWEYYDEDARKWYMLDREWQAV